MSTEEILPQNPVTKRREAMAIYVKISLHIAHRIVNGELEVGKRLSGRSVVSSEYGVSPETIRRSFALLEEMGVVKVRQNSGVFVQSKEAALAYISKHDSRQRTQTLLGRMKELIEHHKEIEKELFEITRILIDSTERFSASNPYYTYEVEVTPHSAVIGCSLGELKFWQQTQATVIAIRRTKSIILSPGPDMLLESDDVLVLVGDHHTKPLVEQLIHPNEDHAIM